MLLFPSIIWDASPDRFNGTSGHSVAPVDFRPLFAEEHIKLPAWNSLLYVSRPWKAARQCTSFLYPTDHNANFCQACGTSTGDPIVSAVQPGLDMPAVNSRFEAVRSFSSCKPYQKQKSSLEQQLSSFLASLSPLKSIPSVTTEDIVKFLISKDGTGRTVVHTRACDRKVCECRRRLAAVSVDSLIRKLRAIYNNLGRSAYSSPVSHLLIKEYLKFVRQEQANSAIVPK